MGLFSVFFPQRTPSAVVAKERLKLVLAHERAGRDGSDFLPALQRELVALVRKYVMTKDDAVEVRLGRHGSTAVLEINIELPPAK